MPRTWDKAYDNFHFVLIPHALYYSFAFLSFLAHPRAGIISLWQLNWNFYKYESSVQFRVVKVEIMQNKGFNDVQLLFKNNFIVIKINCLKISSTLHYMLESQSFFLSYRERVKRKKHFRDDVKIVEKME